MASEYYFLSDLHFGGDGELQHCDFADEFIAFLKELDGFNEAEIRKVMRGNVEALLGHPKIGD